MSAVLTPPALASRDPVVAARGVPDAAGDTVLRALLFLYLASIAVEGPLRFGLSTAGFPNALYLRDAIPAGSLAFLFARELWNHRAIDLRILVPSVVLFAHACLAVIADVEPFPILFAVKIFLFIPYGMAMWPLVRARLDGALAAAALLYAITLAGVGANVLLGRMPWEGLSYDTAFGPVTTTREWWIASGVPRLPGIARTSFNAAMILGITGLLTAIRFPSLWLRLVLAAVTLLAIVATTSKGMVLAYAVAATWLMLDPGGRHTIASRLLVACIAGVALVLPTLVVLLDLGASLHAGSFPDLLVSVWERFATMWPLAFQILPSGAAGLLGAGLGSIGTPQEFSATAHLANAADSLAIYLIINFGVLGVLYYCLPALALPRVQRETDRRIPLAFTAILLIAYGYGLSVNMLEDSFFSICIGLAAGSAWPRRT